MNEYIVPVGDKGNMAMIENELHLQELVRCKDCVNYDRKMLYCNKFGHQDIDDNWFCADGERKEGR